MTKKRQFDWIEELPKDKRGNPIFKINKYLELRFKYERTRIYVDGKSFLGCKYLLFNLTPEEILSKEQQSLKSIDEAEELYNTDNELGKIEIDPRTEFWGHCSNLQVWAENNYNTCLLHRNLAFSLLKELTKAGDPQAKKVFKKEIARRIIEGGENTKKFLFRKHYLNELNDIELETISDAITDKQLKKRILARGKENKMIKEFLKKMEQREKEWEKRFEKVQKMKEETERIEKRTEAKEKRLQTLLKKIKEKES